jgi:hypothetical protein
MSLFSRLFGKSTPPAPEPVLYKDCRIFCAPIREASGHRVAARIEKDFPGGVKVHQMGRADTVASLEEAQALSLSKAKSAIDQLGDALFE